jgi:hypothetical protein
VASHTHREPNHTDFHGAQPFYVGYEGNVRTAVNLALSTQKDPVGPICCFAFGFPGVGKGEFCKALAWELNRVSKFSVVEADCLDIADSPFPQFRRKMDDLEETLWFSAAYPMVLVLDEIDAIAPDRAEGPLQAQTRCGKRSCHASYWQSPITPISATPQSEVKWAKRTYILMLPHQVQLPALLRGQARRRGEELSKLPKSTSG